MENQHSYHDQNISIIPCRRVWDKKNEIYTGKIPAIAGWQKYCDDLPEDEFDGWWSNPSISGFGIVAGEASNIACIDIDSTDSKMIKRIKEIIPFTPCVIVGAKGRGGKFLYRLYDTIHDYKAPEKLKVPIDDYLGKRAVDIMFGNAYLCAPPSFHSSDRDGNNATTYQWEGMSLLQVGVHNLPILDDPNIEQKIKMAIKGMAPKEMEKNLPKGGLDLSGVSVNLDGARHMDMVSYVNKLIFERTPMDDAVRSLLERDILRNDNDPYFLDKTKGHKTDSKEFNAIKFYLGNLEFANRRKKPSDMELPKFQISKDAVFQTYDEWKKPILELESNSVSKFNYDWIPTDALRETVKKLSEANGVSPQCLWFYMLAGYSTLVGNKMKIRPYANYKEYTETCNLYVGMIAASGERKSETTGLALKPLTVLDKKLKKELREKEVENAQRKKDIEVRIKKLHKQRHQEIEDIGIDSDLGGTLLREIKELEQQIPKTEKVSLYEQRATTESLYGTAQDNPTGLFIDINEFGAKFDHLYGKGNENERTFYMDGWDGKKAFKYKTKHQGENYIDELCLSSGFCCQFDVMKDIIWKTNHIGKYNDGYLFRYLMFCSDGDNAPIKDHSFTMPQEIFKLWEDTYYMEKQDEPITLDFDAVVRWKVFVEQIKEKSKISGPIGSAISKYTGAALRLCANLEVMKNGGRVPEFISSETFETVMEIMEYAEEHLHKIFELEKQDTFEEGLNLFRMGIVEDDTPVRDAYRFNQKIFGSSTQECMQNLKVFVDYNIIKIRKSGRSYVIKVNPLLFKD